MNNEIMISINPPYSDLILDKLKPVEFRNKIIDSVQEGTKVYLYETKNKGGDGMVVGEAFIDEVCHVNELLQLRLLNGVYREQWKDRKFNEFLEIIGFGGKYAIWLDGVKRYKTPLSINTFECNGKLLTRPPQNMFNVKKIGSLQETKENK